MNIRALLALGVAVATVNMAASPTASANAPANPAVRGQLAAILFFCARIYPPGEQAYGRLRELVLGQGSDQSPEYRQAFESVSTALANIPHDQALRTCKAATKG